MRAIKFTTDKRGKLLAYRWRGDFGLNSPPDGPMGRWFRVGLEEAKLAVSTGAAYRYEAVAA